MTCIRTTSREEAGDNWRSAGPLLPHARPTAPSATATASSWRVAALPRGAPTVSATCGAWTCLQSAGPKGRQARPSPGASVKATAPSLLERRCSFLAAARCPSVSTMLASLRPTSRAPMSVVGTGDAWTTCTANAPSLVSMAMTVFSLWRAMRTAGFMALAARMAGVFAAAAGPAWPAPHHPAAPAPRCRAAAAGSACRKVPAGARLELLASTASRMQATRVSPFPCGHVWRTFCSWGLGSNQPPASMPGRPIRSPPLTSASSSRIRTGTQAKISRRTAMTTATGVVFAVAGCATANRAIPGGPAPSPRKTQLARSTC
mmetsp:Transcript_4117/g.7544  ORF Transcript_4117/g.7544 Transcript_4117/m.7544 type:complete len:318 (+) Transcript_4117:750-1703(+)